MKIGYHLVSEDQSVNRFHLRDGVVGETCIDSGTIDMLGPLHPTQKDALDEVVETLKCMPERRLIGTIEVYHNRAMNLFIRNGKDEVVGYVTIRP